VHVEIGRRVAEARRRLRSLPLDRSTLFPEWVGWPRRRPAEDHASKGPGGDWPRVTLVTPSYNQAAFLEDAILSVLRQDYPNLEYMVFDGGSNDGSPEIIRRLADRLACWESEPDRGQSHAINKGWERATGRYVWWLNGDDMLAPGSLRRCVEYLEAHLEIDLVYGDLVNIDEGGRLLSPYPAWEFDLEGFLTSGRHVTQPGALMRRDVVGRIGNLDENLHYLMDTEYWIRLALSGGRLVHLPKVLALFRVHEQAKTQTGSMAAIEERYELNRRIYARTDLPPEIRSARRQVTSRMHLECARAYLKLSSFRSALGELRLALSAWPRRSLDAALWWHLLISALGVVVGERAWLRMRQGLRRLRGGQSG
jgi:glycosyltransferase involved in cell wall biosynthesis